MNGEKMEEREEMRINDRERVIKMRMNDRERVIKREMANQHARRKSESKKERPQKIISLQRECGGEAKAPGSAATMRTTMSWRKCTLSLTVPFSVGRQRPPK